MLPLVFCYVVFATVCYLDMLSLNLLYEVNHQGPCWASQEEKNGVLYSCRKTASHKLGRWHSGTEEWLAVWIFGRHRTRASGCTPLTRNLVHKCNTLLWVKQQHPVSFVSCWLLFVPLVCLVRLLCGITGMYSVE